MRQVLTFGAIVAGLLVGSAGAWGQQAGDRVGQQVITKPGTVLKIGRTVVADNQREAGSQGNHPQLVRVYRVKRVSGPWLWLEAEGSCISGWARAAQVVPCDRALDEFTSVLRANPNDGRALLSRGILWLETRQYDKAIADFDAAAGLDPEDVVVLYNRSYAWFKNHAGDKAMADLDEAIRLDPKYAAAFYCRGNLWYMKEEYDKAVAEFDEAVRIDPKYDEAYSSRAMAWHAKREFDKAIADLDKAISLNPMCAAAYQLRGVCWASNGAIKKAMADFNEAIRRDPECAATYNSRGLAWCMREQYDQAIPDFDEAIRRDPKRAQTYYHRARAWFGKKAYPEAIADFSAAIRLDPNLAFAYDNRAAIWATCPDGKYRDGRRAVESATRACELTHWKKAGCLHTLAAACAEAGDFEAAVKWQENGLALTGDAEDQDFERSRLALYQARVPFRDFPPVTRLSTTGTERSRKFDLGVVPSSIRVPETPAARPEVSDRP